MTAARPNTVEDYLGSLRDGALTRAIAVREAILAGAPAAGQSIRYGMPAFHLGGTSYLYFAVWKAHIGLYPIYALPADLEERVVPFRAKTDTLQFRHRDPLPLELITDLARHKAATAG